MIFIASSSLSMTWEFNLVLCEDVDFDDGSVERRFFILDGEKALVVVLARVQESRNAMLDDFIFFIIMYWEEKKDLLY